jgi:hypothetical protein
MFLLSGRMGRSRLNLSISLARMIQWLALSMLASMDYKKDGNDSRELWNMKRRCFIWSISLVSRWLVMHQGRSLAIVSLTIMMRQCNLT